MKLLISCFSLALSLSSMANTIDSKSFVYDGSQNSVELVLNAEKTRTEYRDEQVRRTCVRTEIAGYRTTCVGGYGPRPYPGPRGPRYPRGGRRCYQSPVYRTISYPCTETVRTSYQVKDYDVDARVIIDVTNMSEVATPGETFKVTLNGDSLSFNAVGSKKFFIINKKQDIRSNMRGNVKMMDALLAAELVEVAPVLEALSMPNISLENDMLNFGLGNVTTRNNLGFSLKVEKKKTFGSDTVLLNRELMESEVSIATTANGVQAGVNTNELGLNLSGGKFALTAKVFAKFDGSLMNSSQFGDLFASRTLIYKNR